MNEWIPWLLIIVGWHPDTPDEQRVARVEVTADEAECDQLGNEFVASRAMYREELGPFEYRYFCAPMPDSEAVDEAWQRNIEARADAASRP